MKKEIDLKEKNEDYEKQIEKILSKPISVSRQFENAIDTAFIKKARKIKIKDK